MNTKIKSLLMLVVIMVLLVLVLSPAPVLAAGNTSHFRSSDKGASAFWSECNEVCTDTFIFVSENMSRFNKTRVSGTTLCFDEFNYTFDAEGNFIFISSRFGCADATLSIDKKLTSASASAEVPVTICTEFECTDGGTLSVNASWTGDGPLERSKSNFQFKTDTFMINGHFRGTFRNASASATVDGGTLGASIFAQMFDFRSGEVFVCHGGC